MSSRRPLLAWTARLTALCALFVSGTVQASPLDPTLLWNARFSGLTADVSCRYGDRDCNRCATNVEAQFRSLTQQDARVRRKSWLWERGEYAPDGIKPQQVFSVFPGAVAGDGAHFQSFVRLASRRSGDVSLMASYAGEKPGIFQIASETDLGGQIHAGTLKYLPSAFTTHPGGMQGLGRFALVAHDDALGDDENAAGAYVEFIDADRLPSDDPARIVPLDNTRSQSVGAVKLPSGGYLVVVGFRMNEFGLYYTSSLTSPFLERIDVDAIHSDRPLVVDGEPAGYENISLVTECGTGDIYVIGSTAKGPFGGHDGIWDLLRLQPAPSPSLEFVTRSTRDLYDYACNPRAGGTAFVSEEGKLALYCHQKSQDAQARLEAGICLAGVVTGLVGFDPLFGAACADAIAADTNVLFTEVSHFRDVYRYSVRLKASTQQARNMAFGLREEKLGLDCKKPAGAATASCEWQVYGGQALRFVPYRDPGSINIVWDVHEPAPGSLLTHDGTDEPWETFASQSVELSVRELW